MRRGVSCSGTTASVIVEFSFKKMLLRHHN
jgi:hypothetical protein